MHADSPSRASVPGHEASLSTRPAPPSPPPPHDLLALPSSFGRVRPPPVQEPSPSPPPPSLLPVPAAASADVIPITASGLPPLRTCHCEHERRPQLHIAASGLPPPGTFPSERGRRPHSDSLLPVQVYMPHPLSLHEVLSRSVFLSIMLRWCRNTCPPLGRHPPAAVCLLLLFSSRYWKEESRAISRVHSSLFFFSCSFS